MRAMILALPLRQPRSAEHSYVGSARVHLFPPVRDRRLVAGVAREMRAQPDDDAAEAFLSDHFDQEFRYFSRAGVPEEEIERAFANFSVSVWQAMVRGDNTGEGVA